MNHAFTYTLLLATLLCTLVAGITLVFAILVMPGLRTLGDRAYLEGFKAIDEVIQNNQPVFMLVWVGSALALIAATALGFSVLPAGPDRALLAAALLLFLGGVHVPTATVNIPLNNRLQAQALEDLAPVEIAATRQAFEPRWLRWNTIRTAVALGTSLVLLVVLVRL